MANHNESTEELLLDVRVAEASRLFKFYLNQEKKILGTVSVAIFLILWELVGNTFQLINPMFMSAPSLIWQAAIAMFSTGEIYNDLYISGIELLGGYLLSAVIAVPFGIAIGWYKKVAYIFDPFVNAMNATPRVALLPLVIIWLGIGILSKVGIIFLGAVFPIFDQCPRWGEDHTVRSTYRRPEFRRFRVDALQDRGASLYGSFYPDWIAARTWQGDCRCHGWRALCRHRRHRFYQASFGLTSKRRLPGIWMNRSGSPAWSNGSRCSTGGAAASIGSMVRLYRIV